MTDTATNEDELNPLTGHEDDKKQSNMVQINLNDPHDPPQQQAQEEQSVPGQKQNKDWAAEVGMACNKGYNWFPLGIFAWISGWLLIASVLADMITIGIGFIEFWIYIYLIIGALLVIVIDMPLQISMKNEWIMKFQLVIFDWIKLFRRIWGRCVLYIILMITGASFLADDNDPSDFRAVPWVAGIYLFVLIVLSFIFSFVAAKKYNAIREYIIKATVISVDDGDEDGNSAIVSMKTAGMLEETGVNEEIELKKFISKFDQLNTENTGKVTMEQLATLGEECGNAFSNAEKHAMMLLLDKDCTGFITKPEWILQFRKHNKLRML